MAAAAGGDGAGAIAAGKAVATGDGSSSDEEVVEGVPVGFLRSQLGDVVDGTAPVVLLATGALAPVHRMHVSVFPLGKEGLERREGGKWTVIGGLLSPTHDGYVGPKLGSDHIEMVHRLPMVHAALDSADAPGWVRPCGWEAEQDDFVDFPAVTRAVSAICKEHVREDVVVMFLCGSDHAVKCGLFYGRANYHVVVIGRPDGTSDKAIRFAKPSEKLHLVPAAAGASDVSSTQIRRKASAKETISDLTFPAVEAYMREHQLLGYSKE